jgi:hypothetical protein
MLQYNPNSLITRGRKIITEKLKFIALINSKCNREYKALVIPQPGQSNPMIRL